MWGDLVDNQHLLDMITLLLSPREILCRFESSRVHTRARRGIFLAKKVTIEANSTIQSDSVSRQRPFSTGLFSAGFSWASLSRVDFIVFVLFPGAVGVREYCCMIVETRLEALCFALFPRVTRASRETNPRPRGLVTLDLAESRLVWLGLAESRKKLQQA